jgi:2'-5' RNA ligase
LGALQKRFENECAAEGFPKEDRAYKPHLTIARLRKPEVTLADAHLKLQFEPLEIILKELVVFRSELSPKGSKYTTLSIHHLPNP